MSGAIKDIEDAALAGQDISLKAMEQTFEPVEITDTPTPGNLPPVVDAVTWCESPPEPAPVIIDPIYKVLGERDENSNGDVALVLNCLERIAGNSGAAVIFAHHFAKGSQGGKFAVDRVSGAGAWWRDPDAGLFLTELESEDGFNVHAAARSFPPLDEFAARAEHPLMLRDDDLDHTALKQPGPQKKATAEQVRDMLSEGPLSFSDWHRAAKRELGLSEATFNRRRGDLDEAGTVQKEGDLYYQVTT